ncbi:sulfite exporter TauE/SafE family protein [Lyngbya confervoides]|uniref:Probable membrane transporter protein n=1 Tax=Lyngbya confervoides BDU141951 TaxID=1574623 RepID=A0ABD4T8P7_9CYAN|nr:sulfite exporter TauE/SafE family protein [Lyngbya confervoides]MCM1984870.1 sulfite exporter TauE/SafE family protein [Lyngbya confervoides BDU141951]
MPLSPSEVLLAIAIVTVGATVQSAVGFGLGLVAAPLLLLIDPRLVPAPLMTAGVLLTVLMGYRDRQGIDFHSLKFALSGRLLGMAPAALMLSVASQGIFDLIFAVLVLVAVALSAWGRSLPPTRPRAVLAGAASGFMGTISGIGGPPIALLYQRSHGLQLRGTLAGFFGVGSLLSLLVLSRVGRFGWLEIKLAGVLMPGIALGFALSGSLAARMSKTSVRPFILGLSGAAAMTVLIRALS